MDKLKKGIECMDEIVEGPQKKDHKRKPTINDQVKHFQNVLKHPQFSLASIQQHLMNSIASE